MTKHISRRGFLRGTAAGFGGAALAIGGPKLGLGRVALAQAKPAMMQLGWIANVEYMGMFIADDAGYYKDEGLDMEIVPGGPAVSVAPIVASGKALVGLDSVDTIARARAEGAKLKLIGAELQRNPTAVMSLADKPIKTPQDLVGKKFGVQQNGAEIINLFFRMNNIDPASVTIVPVQFDPAPLVAGEVDAFLSFLTNQPVQLALKGIETNNFLLSDYGYTAWADCLVVHEDSLADAETRKQLVGVVRGTVRGWQDAVVDPKRGATLAVEKYGTSFRARPEGAGADGREADPAGRDRRDQEERPLHHEQGRHRRQHRHPSSRPGVDDNRRGALRHQRARRSVRRERRRSRCRYLSSRPVKRERDRRYEPA